MKPNFLAKFKYGNRATRKKGIVNMHLNIRSLRNKLSEIKVLIKEKAPHILGLSECELHKGALGCDEKSLKIPGYDILYPLSWNTHGYARVIMYVKRTLKYKQILDLQDQYVQSIWIKGGFNNSKMLYFCHCYREHSSKMGTSLQSQRQYLEAFLQQWDLASKYDNRQEKNEVPIVGDMNLDSLNDKWLSSEYHLRSLAKLVQNACDIGGLYQLVSDPTRYQYDSVSGIGQFSCIDHVYTNVKFRCSTPSVEAFGHSDHDTVYYTRYSKVPPAPAKTIRKRSYKQFVPERFLNDLKTANWSEVYQNVDVDIAVERFSSIFKNILDIHAPWILFQKRKSYAAWITDKTKDLINQRNIAKKEATNAIKLGWDASGVAKV